jgi:hypothetical protein
MPPSPPRPWYKRGSTLLLGPPALLLLYVALTAALGGLAGALARGGHGTLAEVVRGPFVYLFYLAGFPVIGAVALELAAIVIVVVRWRAGRRAPPGG